ncbi:MAG: hypothetical protein KDN05_12315, partial [Verrucomicrobiae bacterium]|nr:hypothetical protein [Verrucomicrobiae bacterium]
SVWIVPEPAPPAAVEVPQETPAKREFARTTPDQAAEPDPSARFIGERDTAAASERSPQQDAPDLPSQAGIDPRYEGEIETTQSDYQDGSLDEPAEANPLPPDDSPAMAESAPQEAAASSPPPPAPTAPREELYSGSDPVDVTVPAEGEKTLETPPAPTPLTEPAETEMVEETPPQPEVAAQPPAAAPKEKSFRGFQRKTAIVGSISRTGKSSLDVENTELGRYQAKISKAVELEWQRNCVRHRDFITPGYLTTRFFVDPRGKVTSVQFMGEMQTGEIQKGFTLNSIRDAEIPAMPAALKKDLQGEPLELVFRFFF